MATITVTYSDGSTQVLDEDDLVGLDGFGYSDPDTAAGEAFDYRFMAFLWAMLKNNEAIYRAFSTTSMAIAASGTLTPTLTMNRPFFAGMWARFEDASNSANYMEGEITAYNPTTGAATFTPSLSDGSGTIANWLVFGMGKRGATGAAGSLSGPGSSTANGLATWNGTGGTALLSTAWTIIVNAMTAGGTLDMAGNKLTVDAVDLSYDNLGDKTGTATVIAVPYSRIRLTGDTTVTLTGPAASHGAVRLLEVVQDGTGGWTPTFTGYTWVGDEPTWAGMGAGLTGVLGWYETPTGRKRIWVVEEFA